MEKGVEEDDLLEEGEEDEEDEDGLEEDEDGLEEDEDGLEEDEDGLEEDEDGLEEDEDGLEEDEDGLEEDEEEEEGGLIETGDEDVFVEEHLSKAKVKRYPRPRLYCPEGVIGKVWGLLRVTVNP